MTEVSGRCLCGSISYSCSSAPLKVSVCHCNSCQHQTGTAFSVLVVVSKDDVIIEGENHLGEYVGEGNSGKPVHRKFCKNCGSPMYSLVKAVPNIMAIKAGTLTDKSWLDPSMHTWCDDAQPWVEIAEGVETFPRNPPLT